MPRKPHTADQQPSDTLKLRHHIMNLIYRHGHDSVMIPSSRTLAAQFGLARSTVQLTLEKLIEEGFLFSRQGVGTFTDPARSFIFSGDRPAPLIGLLWGDGKTFYHDHYICAQLAPLTVQLTADGCNLRHLTLTGTGTEAIRDEILAARLDGLVWVFPSPALEPMFVPLAAELPLVTMPVSRPYPGLNSIAADFDAAGKALAETFRSENRHRLLVAVSGHRLNSNLDGLRRALAAADPHYEENILTENPAEFGHALDRALAAGPPPEIMCINGRYAGLAMSLLRRYGIDPQRQCRVLALQNLLPDDGFRGLQLVEDHETAGREAAAVMRRLLRDGNREKRFEHRLIPVEIRQIG